MDKIQALTKAKDYWALCPFLRTKERVALAEELDGFHLFGGSMLASITRVDPVTMRRHKFGMGGVRGTLDPSVLSSLIALANQQQNSQTLSTAVLRICFDSGMSARMISQLTDIPLNTLQEMKGKIDG